MNDCRADHGPSDPSYSARARQRYVCSPVSGAATVRDVVPAPLATTWLSTIVPVTFCNSKRYESATLAAYDMVEFVTTRTTSCPCVTLTPLIGETGVGAVALSVDPSAAASPVPPRIAEGLVGAVERPVQAINPTDRTTATANLRDMQRSRNGG